MKGRGSNIYLGIFSYMAGPLTRRLKKATLFPYVLLRRKIRLTFSYRQLNMVKGRTSFAREGAGGKNLNRTWSPIRSGITQSHAEGISPD
jgi:hypothetical protein